MRLDKALPAAFLFGGAALIAAGCGPTYPKCENDRHCTDKGEFCVNGTCQKCRDNSHCSGPGQICQSGSCAMKPGYCDESVRCSGSEKCRSNECGPECLADGECGGDQYCSGSRCAARPQCGDNALNPECPAGEECVAGGCQVPDLTCSGTPVMFDFDKSNIRSGEREKLDAIASCLKQDRAPSMQIQGHCDERGTVEYNLALGERRADAARRYLINLGVPTGKLSTVSYGEERPTAMGSNETAWSKNRRSEFIDR